MNANEIAKAEKMLADVVDRTERIGIDCGEMALSVQFSSDGTQKVFYTLGQVEEHLSRFAAR